MRWPWARSHLSEQSEVRSESFWIATDLLDRTADILRQSRDGRSPHEGVVYWAGRRITESCLVTTCIAPSAITSWGSFETSARANARVIAYLGTVGLELIAQVHSHPGDFVGHSDGDDRRALMPYEGFLSIVVPSYGRDGMRPFTKCGVHVFESSRFRRLTLDEIKHRFRVVDSFVDLRS